MTVVAAQDVHMFKPHDPLELGKAWTDLTFKDDSKRFYCKRSGIYLARLYGPLLFQLLHGAQGGTAEFRLVRQIGSKVKPVEDPTAYFEVDLTPFKRPPPEKDLAAAGWLVTRNGHTYLGHCEAGVRYLWQARVFAPTGRVLARTTGTHYAENIVLAPERS